MSLIYIIAAILIFGLLIFVHEGGHFLCARLFHVTINEFAIGMGPKVFSRVSKKSGTRYSLRLLPIGGFVSMAGEDEESDDPNSFVEKPVWQRMIITAAGAITNIVLGILVMAILVLSTSDSMASNRVGAFTDGATIYSQNGSAIYGTLYTVMDKDGVPLSATEGEDPKQIYASVAVMDSGKSLMTLVRYDPLEMRFYACDLNGNRVETAVSFTNENTPEEPLYRFTDGTAADFSSVVLLTEIVRGVDGEGDWLLVGDEILSVDGTRTHIYTDLSYELMHCALDEDNVIRIKNDKGEVMLSYLKVDLTVLRDGEKVTLKDVVFPTAVSQGVLFGAPDFRPLRENPSFGGIVKQAFFQSLSTIRMIWDSLFDLLSGHYGVEAVSGPVGVTQTLASAAETGLYQFVYLSVVISMNLGVMNLLPIPALDGGKLVFQVVELIFRKPVNRTVEAYIHFGGIILLMLIMLLITLKDVIGLFG